jgi:hypothetical protein
MTFVSDTPCVGIVYKNKYGSTYTEWYYKSLNIYHRTVDEWIADRLFLDKDAVNYGIDLAWKIMAIVRSK